MNILAFDKEIGDQVDANFMSIYDKETDKFSYILQRLLGLEANLNNLDNGNLWIVYIKGKKYD